MIFKEFGDKNMPVIMLLHGGGLSWWSWKPQIEALQNNYRIITPIIDGHGDAYYTTFVSIQQSAERISEYITENCNGKVFALCGLSIGAQIVVELLSRDCDIAENAVIESALVYPSKITALFTIPMYHSFYGLIKKRWFARQQAKALKVSEELFENYYNDSMKMTKETLINMAKSNLNYSMPQTLSNTKAKTLIIVGEKELPMMKKSATLLHNTIDNSILKVIEKSEHGETSLLCPNKYLDLMSNSFGILTS